LLCTAFLPHRRISNLQVAFETTLRGTMGTSRGRPTRGGSRPELYTVNVTFSGKLGRMLKIGEALTR